MTAGSIRALLVFSALCIFQLLLSAQLLPDRIALTLGTLATRDIRASRSAVFDDTAATQRMQQDAVARTAVLYLPDPQAQVEARRACVLAFSELREAQKGIALAPSEARVAVAAHLLRSLSDPATRDFVVRVGPAGLSAAEARALALVSRAMGRPIREGTDDPVYARYAIDAWASAYPDGARLAPLASYVAAQSLRPNQRIDRPSTDAARRRALRAVPPVRAEVQAGQFLLRRGERVEQWHIDAARALGLLNPRLGALALLGVAIVNAGIMTILLIFLSVWSPQYIEQPRRLAIILIILACGMAGLKLFSILLGLPASGTQPIYLGVAAATACAMLLCELLDHGVALFSALVLAIVAALIYHQDAQILVLTVVCSTVGVLGISRLRDRGQILKTAAAIAFAAIGTTWALGFVLGTPQGNLVNGTVWSVVMAGVALALFWFGIAVLERAFGIVTRVWLLELSSSEHPLLRQLCTLAPATYAHSIMVANLAESAAERVGADRLLCRVASYYHDIGKLRRPQCFAENQTGDNIHDGLVPAISVMIIAAHVRDGIEMARRHRLPPAICDVIAQHHGTCRISIFYERAVAAGEISADDESAERTFRYEGPRPQSRESGIIMLADSVEAATRSLRNPSPIRIEELVNRIVRGKVQDGQLDDCALTLRDIRESEAAFVKTLAALHHARLEYADQAMPQASGPCSNGGEMPALGEDQCDSPATDVGAVAPASCRGDASAPPGGVSQL